MHLYEIALRSPQIVAVVVLMSADTTLDLALLAMC